MKKQEFFWLKFSLLLLFVFILSNSTWAATVGLQWDPNTETDLAGYKVYYEPDLPTVPFDGTEATEGVAPIDVGNITTTTISGLDANKDYYFAVTAYDTEGLESSYSNVVKVTAGSTETLSFDLTSSASGGGAIFPFSGILTIPRGDNQTFTIIPSIGYHIESILVDGISVTVSNSYTFTDVQAVHSISVTFAPDIHTITGSVTSGQGTIFPSGTINVATNEYSYYSFAPAIGYYVADVKINNVSIGAVPDYIFWNPISNQTIAATFALSTFPINATTSAGGTIFPAGYSMVGYGGSIEYTITPNAGYAISSITLDSVPLAISGNKFLLASVTGAHTINVTFAQFKYLLWKDATGQACIWKIDPTGAHTILHLFPAIVGWTPISYSMGADGNGYLFWRDTTGKVCIWKIDPTGGHTILNLFDAISGWTPLNYSRDASGNGYLLWKDTTGQACIWKIDPTGAHTILHLFPAIVGWTPLNYSRDAAGNGYLLWKDATGQACIWKIDPTGAHTILHLFPAIVGWTPISYSMGADGNGYLFWRDATGKVCIWKIDPTGAHTILHLFPAIVGWTPLFY